MPNLRINSQSALIRHVIILVNLALFACVYAQEPQHLLWMKGVAATRQGNYSESATYFTELILSDSTNYDYYFRRGKAFLMAEKNDSALVDFLSAEKRKNGVASYEIACCYALMNKPAESVEWLKKHLQTSDRLPEAKIKLDKSFRLIENTKEWNEVWKNNWYTKAEQNTAEAIYLIESSNPVEAVARLSEWITRYPKKHEWYFLRARAYNLLGNKSNALKDLNQAIDLNKRQPEYFWQRAILLLESGKYGKAAEDFSRVLKLDPSRLDVYQERARALAAEGKFSSSLDDMTLYLSLFPKDPRAHYYHGFILYTMRMYADAIKALDLSITIDRSVPEFFYQRGLCHLEMRNYKNAIHDFAQALDLNPEIAEAWYQKGMARMYNGDLEGACNDLKKAATLGNKDAYKQSLQLCTE